MQRIVVVGVLALVLGLAACSSNGSSPKGASSSPTTAKGKSSTADAVARQAGCSSLKGQPAYLGGPEVVSLGTCTVGGKQLTIAVYKTPTDRQNADKAGSTRGCSLLKAVGGKSFWTVSKDTWNVTTQDEKAAKAVGTKVGIAPVKTACS
jgi:hypothetical protein